MVEYCETNIRDDETMAIVESWVDTCLISFFGK